MRRITIIFFLAAVTIMFFAACHNKETRIYMSRIDSITAALSEAEMKLAEVNHDSISAKYALYQEYAKKINNDYFKKDVQSPEWKYMTLYHYVRKPFRNIASNHADYLRQITQNREQLDNLKHDIRNNALAPEEIETYIREEKRSAAVFVDKIIRQVDAALKEEINFDTVHPQILKMLAEMENIRIKGKK